jgi:hypothetical protein
LLRREAGFGCCVCGNPIFQYHHIIEQSKEQHFRVEDMMVLCNNHHDEATAGVFTEAQQREAKASPRNKRDGHAGGLLRVTQPDCRIALADSTFVVGDGSVVEFNEEPLLEVGLGEARNLLLDLSLYDQSDQLLTRVEEKMSGSPINRCLGTLSSRIRD